MSSADAKVLSVQRMVGNQATSALLQRAPPAKAQHPPQTAQAESESAVRDYDNALHYVTTFYGRVRDGLNLVSLVKKQGEENYFRFGELKDPPSLGAAITKAVFSLAFSLVPGWSVIERGIESGIFASDLGKLKASISDPDNPWFKVSDVEKQGPTSAQSKSAKRHTDRVRYGSGSLSDAATKIWDLLEKRAQAAAEEAKALEAADLGRQRITDWARSIESVQHEEEVASEWVKQAGPVPQFRGRLEQTVVAWLGPLVTVHPDDVEPLTKRYELALYRGKLGGSHGSAKFVRIINDATPGTKEPSIGELRVAGGLSHATRRRIAYCADLNQDPDNDAHTDDPTMARVLGVETVIEHTPFERRFPGSGPI